MKKWLAVIFIVIASLLPQPVSAGVTTDVLITAKPGWGILTFTATYINDTQVDLDWTYAPGITNVIIRAKYGSEPASETDGYLVYSGAGLSTSDMSMNFDETLGILYYKAYGETAPGVYGASASDDVEGLIMAIIALFVFGGVLSYLALRSNFPALKMAAGFGWFAVWVYVKDNPIGTMTEGSSAHSAVLLVLILAGVAMMLTTFGGNVNRQRPNAQNGGSFNFSGWKWGFGKDRDEYEGRHISRPETAAEYQMRVRAALRRDVK